MVPFSYSYRTHILNVNQFSKVSTKSFVFRRLDWCLLFMFQVEDSWTSLIGGLLAATRGLLKTRRDRSEPKMFDEDDIELSDEYADDDDRGSDDGTGLHTSNTSNY